MVGDNVGLIDVGTNSFHLLISKVEEYGFESLVKKQTFVQLFTGGIDVITPEKFKLGIEVLKEFKKSLEDYNVVEFKAFGTAGLRKAKNSAEFRNAVKEELDICIEVIEGDEEARLIWEGVRSAMSFHAEKRLIMDIGGGSTEFIIGNDEEIFWKKSYPIGAGVLLNQFHHSDPMTNDEFVQLVEFLTDELSELWEQIDLHQPENLIGASGSFRSLVNLQRTSNSIFPIMEGKSEVVNLSGFKVAHLQMLKSTLAERLKIPDLEPKRAPLMPVATTLMSLVLSHLKPTRSIVVSRYALNEGMLSAIRDNYYEKTV